MITLNNVNKYYNRHKKNEIHVINNTSLSFSDKGLVALLGPSGCGKTTILNSIGGLDKISKGKIFINGKKISSRNSRRVDKIRNINIGYIFQDYKLIDNLSVYDNVALSLKLVGIKDKKEIKTRVEYVLDKVGMLRYKYRPANMLSGGERQRVGIARAIVKDPDIILADEPTGNLDSKNSLEIMKIISAISREKLVILVTHEENLAKFYATRIIELQDGKVIKDYKNTHKDELDYIIDNTFYLKDFKHSDNIGNDNINLNVYSDSKEKLDLNIVIKNGNLYIETKNDEKIEVVDEFSSIEFVDEHYKKIAKDDIDKYNFNFSEVINKNIKKKYSSIINMFTLIINGFKKVFDYSVLKKILLFGFLFSSMFIMYSVSTICASFNIRDKDFIEYNKNYLQVNLKKIKVNDYLNYESYPDINYIIPGNSKVKFSVNIKDFYQTADIFVDLEGSLADVNLIKESDIISGEYPTNEYEIVVDKLTLERNFDDKETYEMIGIKEPSDMIGRTISIDNLPDFKIVGVVDMGSPSIYANKNLFISILSNMAGENDGDSSSDNKVKDYNLFMDKITLKRGRLPEADYEVMVNINDKDSMPLNKTIDTKVNDIKLTVVGYYESKYEYDYKFVNSNTVKYDLLTESSNLSIVSNNKDKTLEDFRDLKLNIEETYTKSKNSYIKSKKKTLKTTLIVSGIILLISLVEIFFMIRSSFLSRIKEIGIFRAIGVKKSDIYKMFYGEIFAITTIASVPGVLFMAYSLYNISKIKYFSNLFLVNPIIVMVSIIFTYLFNLVIGLVPVHNVLRKRPAVILSRHDLD